MPFWFSYSEPCSVAGGSGRRTGTCSSRGSRGSPATISSLNLPMPPGKPSSGQASAARNWNSSRRRSLVRQVGRRAVHRAHVVDGDRAGLAGQRDRRARSPRRGWTGPSRRRTRRPRGDRRSARDGCRGRSSAGRSPFPCRRTSRRPRRGRRWCGGRTPSPGATPPARRSRRDFMFSLAVSKRMSGPQRSCSTATIFGCRTSAA